MQNIFKGRFTDNINFTDNNRLEDLYKNNSMRKSLLLRDSGTIVAPDPFYFDEDYAFADNPKGITANSMIVYIFTHLFIFSLP